MLLREQRQAIPTRCKGKAPAKLQNGPYLVGAILFLTLASALQAPEVVEITQPGLIVFPALERGAIDRLSRLH